jgi:hypothetical protein
MVIFVGMVPILFWFASHSMYEEAVVPCSPPHLIQVLVVSLIHMNVVVNDT